MEAESLERIARNEQRLQRTERIEALVKLGLIGATFALVVVLVYVVLGPGTDKLTQGFATVELQRRDSARIDCRGNISAARQDVRDALNLQNATTNHAFDDWLIGAIAQDPTTPDKLKTYSDATAALGVAADAARDLPRLEEIVDHGGTISGQHFDACPKL